MNFRGGLGICGIASVIAAVFIIACSDDDSTGGSGTTVPDASGVDVIQPPPPPPPNFPDPPAPPPDLQSRTGFLGNATLIADVGEPTDGPAWRNADGALYFTVPGSANPLRRVVPGGTPSIVAVDAGAFAPVGIANSGGSKLYVTERQAIVTLDVGDAGDVTGFARMPGLGGTSFSDIHSVPPEPRSFFVDVANTRLYDFIPPNQMSLLLEVPDAGKATAIAARESSGEIEVYIGASGTQFGLAVLVYTINGTSTPQLSGAIDLEGIPPNGIAVDSVGRVYVAWAKGIDVAGSGDSIARQSDGYGALPIAAVPTSLAFGGADGKTLFVTTVAGKIYSIPVQATGRLR